MRLEQFEVHLNELLHDLNSPLSSMRLQLGLLRSALEREPQSLRRVENAERQLLRSQRIIDAFVSACSPRLGATAAGDVVRRVFGRFGINVSDDSLDAVVAVEPQGLDLLIRSLAEGCVTFMAAGTCRASIEAGDGRFVVCVSGEFEQGKLARALRLSFVDDDGEPKLALATTRIAAAAANGALLLERDALVLRLPLVSE